MPDEERMISVDEAAHELGIGRTTLYRYVERMGLQTYRRIGDRRSYLRAADLDRLKGFTPRDQDTQGKDAAA